MGYPAPNCFLYVEKPVLLQEQDHRAEKEGAPVFRFSLDPATREHGPPGPGGGYGPEKQLYLFRLA